MSPNLMGLRENPFAAGHDPRLIHANDTRVEIVAGFRQALAAGEPFILVSGEAGVGKTSVVTQVLAEEKAWSAIVTNPLLTRAELLEEICLRFGVDLPESVSKPRLLAELERHLVEIRREEGAPVLVVDEAHDLSLELLEELRLLSNLEFKGQPLLQIVLVGLPALEARLAQADLAQLRQRIGAHLRLRPLDAETTWRYIHHRVAAAGGDGAERFPDETCLEIHRLTRGVPRAINTLAGHALLAASRESERVVTVRHVQSSAADTWLRNVADAPPSAGVPVSALKPSVEKARPKTSDPQPEPPAASEPKPAPAAKPAKPAPKAQKAAPPPSPPPSTPPTTAREHGAAEPKAQVEPETGAELPPRTSGEPEVREWISRFVDPDNPIQIGVRAGLASQPFLDAEAETELDEAAPDPSVPSVPKPRAARSAPPPRSRARMPDTRWITAGAGVVLLAATVVVMVPRMRPRPSAPADSAAVTAAPSSSPEAELRTKGKTASAPVSQKPAATSPRRTAAVDTVAAPRHWQGLEVATYLDPYRASAESNRLSELTGLSSRVLQTSDQAGDAYRVVLGSFGSRKKAERMADDLVRRGVIDQARVVPLGAIAEKE